MRLTRYSDYALRTALYLAAQTDRLSAIADVAAAYDVPENNLRKVVNDLVRAGFFESVRGRSGGVRLARDPSEIRVGEMLRVTEGHQAMVDCTGCFLAPTCGLIPGLADAREAFFAALDGKTLADLVDERVRCLPALAQKRRAAQAMALTAEDAD
ncbi:RrF2 family transcriptional regulator [Rhodovulum sp. DZ06]|uniref:RrF2 family transcriptional regulator n=1 Tax=Rhodovulum sp. DZ06 TaxID=3425126 RepID=UPI003D334373